MSRIGSCLRFRSWSLQREEHFTPGFPVGARVVAGMTPSRTGRKRSASNRTIPASRSTFLARRGCGARTSPSQPAQVPKNGSLALTGAGQSSVAVPLGSINGDPQLRNSIPVQSNAAKGALYASMVVFGGTAIPSVQLLGRDYGQPYNGGAHPGTTAGGAASTLVVSNYGEHDASGLRGDLGGNGHRVQLAQWAASRLRAMAIRLMEGQGRARSMRRQSQTKRSKNQSTRRLELRRLRMRPVNHQPGRVMRLK